MKRNTKKILAVLLAAIMLLSTMPLMGAFAAASVVATGPCEYGVEWTLYSDGLLRIWKNGGTQMSFVAIGNSLKEQVKRVEVEEGITDVGGAAFYGMINLESVSLPDSVTVIGKGAFSQCPSLKSITIPKNVTEIGEHAFAACLNLESIVIPSKVTKIGEDAFLQCFKLKTATVNNSIVDLEGTKLGFSEVKEFNVSYDEFVEIYKAFFKSAILEESYENNNEEFKNSVVANDEGAYLPMSGVVMYGYAGSPANTYANKYGFEFNPMTHTHEYTQSVTKKATCTEDGIKTFTCECGYTYSETIPMTGHTPEAIPAVAATCTKDGSTEGSRCKTCNTVITAPQTIPSFGGHAYGEWTITKEATCTAKGSESRTCSVCNNTETKSIPANGHVDEDGDNICEVCGASTEKKNIIEAIKDMIYNFVRWIKEFIYSFK